MKKIVCLMVCVSLVLAVLPVSADTSRKALIVYFDYSENIDTTGLDVDAISSASIAEGPGVRERSNLLVMLWIITGRECWQPLMRT